MATDPALALGNWRFFQGGLPLNPTAGTLISGAYHFRNGVFSGSESHYDYNGLVPPLYSTEGTVLEPIATTAIPI